MNPVLNSHLRLLEHAVTMCICTRVLFTSFVTVLCCASAGALQVHVHLHVLVVGASVRAGIYCTCIAAHVQVCICNYFSGCCLFLSTLGFFRVTSYGLLVFFFLFIYIDIYIFFLFFPYLGFSLGSSVYLDCTG